MYNDTRSENAFTTYITEFENATDNLRQKFDSRRSVITDVEEVLNRAYFIDSIMHAYSLTPNALSQWMLICKDLHTLST